MTQGRRFSEETIKKIRHLLAKTDLTIQEIAERMGCSRANVVAVNRKFIIRVYNKRRQHWQVDASKKVDVLGLKFVLSYEKTDINSVVNQKIPVPSAPDERIEDRADQVEF